MLEDTLQQFIDLFIIGELALKSRLQSTIHNDCEPVWYLRNFFVTSPVNKDTHFKSEFKTSIADQNNNIGIDIHDLKVPQPPAGVRLQSHTNGFSKYIVCYKR